MFSMFIPICGNDPILLFFFQMGWFNHQLDITQVSQQWLVLSTQFTSSLCVGGRVSLFEYVTFRSVNWRKLEP